MERRRLSDQVVALLREVIVEGEIAPGDPLPPERELARQFGVSSVVIREALKTLSAGGLLTVRHGVGSFVTTPDHWHVAEPIAALIRDGRADLQHVLEVRSAIEIAMSGHAAERCDPVGLQALDEALASMARSIHDPVANVAADMEFHHSLAAVAGNPVLALVLQPILAPIRACMLRGTRLPDSTARAIQEHQRIRDAIVARDVAAAQAAMRAHMHTAQMEVSAHQRAVYDPASNTANGLRLRGGLRHGNTTRPPGARAARLRGHEAIAENSPVAR